MSLSISKTKTSILTKNNTKQVIAVDHSGKFSAIKGAWFFVVYATPYAKYTRLV